MIIFSRILCADAQGYKNLTKKLNRFITKTFALILIQRAEFQDI